MTDLLSVQGLHKNFGGIKVLRGLDFQVPEGAIRVLLGPNGCGKSTLLKTIIGLHSASAGDILFDGMPISTLKPHEIARLGISTKLQVPSIFKDLSVYQNMRIAVQRQARRAEVRDRLIGEALDTIRLASWADRRAGDLAHGHQQWLEIGMAIANQPRVLLLDEPTAGMTPQETQDTVQIIAKLNRDRGMSIVIVEHDMAFVASLSAHILVLNQGTILFGGTLAEVRANADVKEIYFGSRG